MGLSRPVVSLIDEERHEIHYAERKTQHGLTLVTTTYYL
jgi:hypothetical protein